MGILNFIASLIHSLSWPIVILVIALSFRKELKNQLLRISSVKSGDLQVEFEKEIEKIEQITIEQSTISKQIEIKDLTSLSIREKVLRIAATSPEAAILYAWTAVETEIANTVANLAISPDYAFHSTTMHNIQCLKDYSKASTSLLVGLDHLRAIRNKLAHRHKDLTVNQDDASVYGHLAENTISQLIELRRSATNQS